VKNFLLTNERTFKRKIQEVILARRLEHAFTKQDILTIYLNQIDFGHNTFGVVEAAKLYFGKELKQLNVGEAAMLGGLPKEPEKFYRDLHGGKHPEAAKARQAYVLQQLANLGKISQAEAQKWIDAPIQVVKQPFPDVGSAPEWVDLARKELLEKLQTQAGGDADKAKLALDELGAKVRTTLDPALQANAQKALQIGLRVMDKRHKVARAVRSVKPDKLEAEVSRLAKALPAGGPQAHQVYEAVVTEVHDDTRQLDVDLGHFEGAIALEGETDARYNPPDDAGTTKKPSERFKIGDVIQVVIPQLAGPHTGDEESTDDPPAARVADGKPENKPEAKPDDKPDMHRRLTTAKPPGKQRIELAPGPEGAVVIIDVKTRKVRALVGGYATKAAGFNRATMAKRQPGSAFKPFVYTTAFQEAVNRKCHANDPSVTQLCATPASVVNDAPEKYQQWAPKNFESGEFLGAVRLRTALAKSINTVSVHIALDVKPETIVGVAHKMGITSNLPAEVAVALGADEVTPLELVNAYATLAAGGVYAPPRFIDAIDGKVESGAAGDQVIAPELAYVVTDMMRSVVTEGTAAEVGAKLKIPIAGKTGTSNEARNTWFIGMTPDYVIGVWVGYDDNRPMPGEQGARVAAPIFIDIARDMNLPAKTFPRPAHVVEATIVKDGEGMGLIAPPGAPKGTTITEVFVEGTQPTEVAPMPGETTAGQSVTGGYGD
jgi:penicillin-binding protein 1A